MELNYLNLPIGNISKEKLRPWLQWLSCQKFDEFSSFPEVCAFFTELFLSEDLKTPYIIDYRHGSYEEADEFIKKEILFLAHMNIFSVGEDLASHIVVKFFLNGTVEVDEVYLDDSMLTKPIEENLKNIDIILEQKQLVEPLSWKEFTKLYEEITLGVYGREHVIPEF